MDDDDYTGIDEIIRYITVGILILVTIVFLAAVAGFIWGIL